MKLESMTLKNFRQYYGEQKVHFSTDPQRNVTVVNGVNGAGKTSLLKALTWCLYGIESGSTMELINKRALMETSIGSEFQMSVEISFSHSGERHIVCRVMTGERTGNDRWLRGKQATLTLGKIRLNGKYEAIENATGVIESILPSSVSSYFFFDGEKIDDFAKPEHNGEVKEAVRNVLKITVLERAEVHLKAVARELGRELGQQSSADMKRLLDGKDKLETKIENKRSEIENWEKERAEVQKQVADIENRLAQLVGAREWETQRRQVTARMEALASQRDGCWTRIRDLCNEGFVPLAEPAMENALAILDLKREKGEMPPGIREQFIHDLLDRHLCICGRPITDGSKEQTCLQQLSANVVSGDVVAAAIQVSGNIRATRSRCTEMPAKILGVMRERLTLDKEIEICAEKLDEISRQLKGFDHGEISGLENKRTEYHNQIGSFGAKISRGREDVLGFQRELGNILKEIDKVEVKQEKIKKIQRCHSLAERSATAVEQMSGAFASDMRHQIQEEAKKIFDKLVWKDSQFKNISLSDTYHLEVLDRWDLPARQDLSAGERQVLSLSFIAGLSTVTGEEAPLVIDTPFGRLSSKHRENVMTHIPELAKQLILFVTDEELHGKARENVQNKIGQEYDLIFDQSTGCTAINQVL